MKKVPLLQLLQSKYPATQKKELHAAVLCGEVRVNGERVTDPKRQCPVTAAVEIAGSEQRFVSRGGYKLEAALQRWSGRVTVRGRVWLDAGASSGGFTDCLLQHGARAVHAVDVGYNQLDYRLRRDARVYVHERTNIMDLSRLEPCPAAAAADLSFRSLRGAAEHLLSLTAEGMLIALAKPQFETPRLRDSGYDGIIRGPQEAADILHSLIEELGRREVRTAALMPSPVPGRAGNREFLLLLTAAAAFRGNENKADGVGEREIRCAAEEAFRGGE
jgi:23S rRNA (cytidine1920-2'-O)/16S rRNA (cytidine1409-2'-O)-methyltransferase